MAVGNNGIDYVGTAPFPTKTGHEVLW